MSHPDQMRFRKGGGVLILFGLPFFLMSAFFLVMGLRGEMKTESGDVASPLFVILFSIPFLSVGLGLIFGRAGVDIDRRAGSVTSWWGFLFLPIRSKRHDLTDFTHVILRRKVIKSKNSSRVVYPFALAPGEGDDVECAAPRDYSDALRRAESLAKFTGLNLHDVSAGHTIIREAAYLDETVAQRARRLGLAVDWPEPPPLSRIRYETVDDTVVFHLPPTPFPWLIAVMTLPALAFVLFFLFAFFIPLTSGQAGSNMPPGARVFFYAFMSLFILIPMGIALTALSRGIVKGITLAASGQGIQIETRGLLRARTWTFPADELEELAVTRTRLLPDPGNVPPGAEHLIRIVRASRSLGRDDGLRLRSDRALLTFGSHLTDDELSWLHTALTYILVHAPNP